MFWNPSTPPCHTKTAPPFFKSATRAFSWSFVPVTFTRNGLNVPDNVPFTCSALTPQPLPSVALSCHTMKPPDGVTAASGKTWSPSNAPTTSYSVPFVV